MENFKNTEFELLNETELFDISGGLTWYEAGHNIGFAIGATVGTVVAFVTKLGQ